MKYGEDVTGQKGDIGKELSNAATKTDKTCSIYNPHKTSHIQIVG
jgi:hypothetical protein